MKQYTHSQYSYVNITEINFDEIEKIDIDQCKQSTQTLQEYYNQATTKPDVMVNGGLFYMKEGTPVLTLLNEGKLINHEDWLKLGMGIVGDKKLVNGSVFDGTEYRDFISAYPVLIKKGSACAITYAKELDYRARRTVVGWNDFTLYLISVDDPGMDFFDLQTMLVHMDIEEAINLDGGGSTCKLINGQKVTKQTYNRPVDNVLCVYLKKEEEKILYRVQAGAFKVKSNSKRLQKKIQSLPDSINAGYKNAYVRLINGLYKVQIGAFSKKENAQKVVEDLEKFEIPSFITTL